MIYFVDWCDDYEKAMISYLKKENLIGEITCLSKQLYSINKRTSRYKIKIEWLLKKYIRFKYKHISKDDILIFKESLFFKYIDIAKHLECKKILLLRSSIKESKDVNFSIAKKTFDNIYSFDKEDCKKQNIAYLEQFLPFGFNEIEDIKKNINTLPKHCFFLGRDKGRIEEVEYIAKVLEENSQIINFHVVRDKTSVKESKYYRNDYLNYDENINNVLNSEILIEINREGQSGLTLRALEAIFFNKKLITNNPEIENYDFYSPEQIFILGKKSLGEIDNFLNTKFTPVRNSVLYQYTPDAMFKKIIENIYYPERS